MPKPMKKALKKIHMEALEKYTIAVDHDKDNREGGLEELQFACGDQWTDKVRADRIAQGRIMMTFNRMMGFVGQVVGEMRQNKPALSFHPSDKDSDKKIGEIFSGIVRETEYRAGQGGPYVSAGSYSVMCGIGNFRVLTEYESDASFDQRLKIISIPDPFSVVWDPLAKEPTRSDAGHCFVTDMITGEDFKRQYPDATVIDFDTDSIQDNTWRTKDTYRVAEYWWKEPVKKTIGLFNDGSIFDLEKMGEEDKSRLGKPAETRVVETFKVRMAKMSGLEILGEVTEWPGSIIPIVAVVGHEIFVGEKAKRFGLTRFAMDAQRAYNYSRSSHAEVVSLQPRAPYLATSEQIGEHREIWDKADKTNYAYLPYVHIEGQPKPERTAPPLASPGLSQEMAVAVDDMKATTGIFDASLGDKSNETSGIALQRRQQQSSTANYNFIDNLSKSVLQAGKIFAELIPVYYDAERVVRILNEDGTSDQALVNTAVKQPPKDGNTPEDMIENDLSLGSYDVRMTVGPSYATKRLEATDSMLSFLGIMPEQAPLVADLVAGNMDWPGADEFAKRFKKMLPEGLAQDEPTSPEEKAEADFAAQQAQEQQKRIAQAEEVKLSEADSDARKAEAEADKSEVEAASAAVELAAMTGQMTEEIIAGVLAAINGAIAPETVPQEQAQPNGPQQPRGQI